jgi:arylformamidase
MLRLRWIVAGAMVLALTCATASAFGSPRRGCTGPSTPQTVAYEQLPGAPVNATSLDIYAPKPTCRVAPRRAPVVMWVHGGGYHIGDKSNQVGDKRRLFNARGYVFISVNYRLTSAGDPTSAHYPDHYRDVAAAVAWVRTHISSWGGNPHRIALLGHSAGADIVANVITNTQWLGERALPLRTVRCAGTFDTEGFDKTRVPDGTDESAQWQDALGNDPAYKRDTSATLLAKPHTGIPKTITVTRGTPLRRSIETDFASRLRSLGVSVSIIDASSLTHEEVNSRIGAPGDTVMTPPLMRFLRTCFSSHRPIRPSSRPR